MLLDPIQLTYDPRSFKHHLTTSMPAVPNCCCSKGSAPHWSNPLFVIFDIQAPWHSHSVLSARVPKCQVGQISMAKCKALTESAVKGSKHSSLLAASCTEQCTGSNVRLTRQLLRKCLKHSYHLLSNYSHLSACDCGASVVLYVSYKLFYTCTACLQYYT